MVFIFIYSLHCLILNWFYTPLFHFDKICIDGIGHKKQKKGPIQNQLREIATKVKDDNFSFRSNSRGSQRSAKRIEMGFLKKWKNKKNNFSFKKIRKFSDNE